MDGANTRPVPEGRRGDSTAIEEAATRMLRELRASLGLHVLGFALA